MITDGVTSQKVHHQRVFRQVWYETLFRWYVLRVPRQRVPTTFFRVLHFFSRNTREHCATSQSAATAAAF